MNEINKHGLSRYIPAEIARTVRKECGFGCVICGKPFYTIEHFNPVFSEAREHNPTGMALLCGGCQNKTTKGVLSKKRIAEKRVAPICLEKGHTFGDVLEIEEPHFMLGRIRFVDVVDVIVVNEKPIIKFEKADHHEGPWLLTALFEDKDGNTILHIDRNEIKIYSTNWDFESVGNKLVIRQAKNNIALELKLFPPDCVQITKLNTFHGGKKIQIKDSTIQITNHKTKITTRGEVVFANALLGLEFHDEGISIGDDFSKIKFVKKAFENTRHHFKQIKFVSNELPFLLKSSHISFESCSITGGVVVDNSIFEMCTSSLFGGIYLKGRSNCYIGFGSAIFGEKK